MTSPADPSFQTALLLVALLCWTFWIVTFRRQGAAARFEVFAVDFAVGSFLLSAAAAILLGNLSTDLPFSDRLLVSSKTAQVLGFMAGMLFGLGNTLLLGAVSLLGIARGFALCGSVALFLSAVFAYRGSHLPSAGLSAALFAVAAMAAVLAARAGEAKRSRPAKGQPPLPFRLRRSSKGILVAALGGAALAASYPLAMRAMFDDFGLGPYAAILFLCLGALVVNAIFSLYFFNIALEGPALKLRQYFQGGAWKHVPGIVGGAIWAAGALAAAVSQDPTAVKAGTNLGLMHLPLASVALVAVLGLVVFREAGASDGQGRARALVAGSAAMFLAGLYVAAASAQVPH